MSSITKNLLQRKSAKSLNQHLASGRVFYFMTRKRAHLITCRFTPTAVDYLSRLTANRVDDYLGKGDRVFSWCRVVGSKSSFARWSACTFASQYQTKIERKLIATSEGELWVDGNEWLGSQKETSALISHSLSQSR